MKELNYLLLHAKCVGSPLHHIGAALLFLWVGFVAGFDYASKKN